MLILSGIYPHKNDKVGIMCTVSIAEIFESLQGESTYAGLPCFFVRLSGCNLRCRYCDTRYAYQAGTETRIDNIVKLCRKSKAVITEITGGEPLLQPGFPALAKALRDKGGKKVLVETNGSCDISLIPDEVVAVMDVKCPGSGEKTGFDPGNIKRLRKYDEVKFVISSRADYLWSKAFLVKNLVQTRCNAVLFSPVVGKIRPELLGKWIARDGLPVRLQVQLHKLIGVK